MSTNHPSKRKAPPSTSQQGDSGRKKVNVDGLSDDEVVALRQCGRIQDDLDKQLLLGSMSQSEVHRILTRFHRLKMTAAILRRTMVGKHLKKAEKHFNDMNKKLCSKVILQWRRVIDPTYEPKKKKAIVDPVPSPASGSTSTSTASRRVPSSTSSSSTSSLRPSSLSRRDGALATSHEHPKASDPSLFTRKRNFIKFEGVAASTSGATKRKSTSSTLVVPGAEKKTKKFGQGLRSVKEQKMKAAVASSAVSSSSSSSSSSSLAPREPTAGGTDVTNHSHPPSSAVAIEVKDDSEDDGVAPLDDDLDEEEDRSKAEASGAFPQHNQHSSGGHVDSDSGLILWRCPSLLELTTRRLARSLHLLPSLDMIPADVALRLLRTASFRTFCSQFVLIPFSPLLFAMSYFCHIFLGFSFGTVAS